MSCHRVVLTSKPLLSLLLLHTLSCFSFAHQSLLAHQSLPNIWPTTVIEVLSQHPQWLALLHFRPHLPFGQLRSEVDDARFFLSNQGHVDARVELVATLNAFTQKPQNNLDQLAQCRCRFSFSCYSTEHR